MPSSLMATEIQKVKLADSPVEISTFFPRGDVGAQIDISEGSAANLAAEPVLVSHPELHPACKVGYIEKESQELQYPNLIFLELN